MDRKSEPDNQFDAYLRHPDCRDVLCDVHVWMPRGNHSDMQIEIFAQYSEDLKALMGRVCRLESETYETSKTFEFIGSGVYIKSVAMKNPGRRAGRARIQLLAISDVVIRNLPCESDENISYLNFPLSDISFAVQNEFVVPDYRGQLLIEEEKGYVIPCPQYSGFFTIKKHAGWVHHSNNEKSVYRFPVLLWESDVAVSQSNVFVIEKLADDVALLISFAARHRVLVQGCGYSCEREKYQKLRNPLERNKSPVSEIPNNELIPLDSFESFMGAALEYWNSFSEKTRQAIRQAIVALHPLTEPSVVRDYLASFSAFEGVVSCLGDAELITGRDWKQIETFLCKCIGESEMSSAHKKLIKEKLPELKRESLASKANRFLEVKKIYVMDLLPVFEGKASLLKIRNRLAHGDGFHNDSEVLIAAGEHLKVLLERVVIRCLGGDIAQTNAGVTQIRQGYYFSPDRVNELKVKLEVMVNSD